MHFAKFIIDYFASKNLSLLTAFLCWKTGEVSEFLRLGSQDGMRIRVHLGGSDLPDLPPYRVYREGMILDVNCAAAAHVFNQASANRAFNLRHSWLLIDNSQYNFTHLQEIISNTLLLPDADVTWASSDTMKDVYRVKGDQPLVVSNLGERFSRQEMEELWLSLPTAVTRRKDLNYVYLNAATIITQPQYFKGWSDLSDRQIDTFPKFTYPLLMLCAEDLHFRYNLRQVDLYGDKTNGTFNGLMGYMQRGELEVGVTSMFMRADRWPIVHYCAETVEVKGAFVFRQPSRAAVSNVFALPFSAGVWGACVVVWGAAGLLLAAVGRLAPRASDQTLTHLTASECFTYTIGTVCQQGSNLSPRLLSIRVLMFSTLLASLFVFTSYSAKIVAIIQSPSDAIQSISDLTRSPMAMGVQETTYKKVYFAESTDPATRALFNRKLLPLGERAYLSVVDGIDRVRMGLFAFQVEQSSAYDIISKTYTEREKCGLKEIKAFTLPMVAVPLRKHSGYRDLFAARLRWQREVGLMDRSKRVWTSARPRCEEGSGGVGSVALADVRPAFLALLAGIAAGVAALLSEALWARTHRNTA